MSIWYVAEPALPGAGHQTRPRRAVERILGADAASRVARRLSIQLADVRRAQSPTGRATDRYLAELEGAYRGQQCVIIGNGPSLNRTDLSLLAGRHTFGLNRLYLMFDKVGFATEFHVVVNRLVVEQCASELVAVPGRLISSWPNRSLLRARHDAIYLQQLVGPLFSMDARRGVWEGATVTYVALQLAYFMGFEEAVLIGVDHRFSTQGRAHALVTTETQDHDHFDPSYFGRGFRWQLPDLETSETAYQLAKSVYARAGRRVIDCTVEGALDVFPKADLAGVLRGR